MLELSLRIVKHEHNQDLQQYYQRQTIFFYFRYFVDKATHRIPISMNVHVFDFKSVILHYNFQYELHDFHSQYRSLKLRTFNTTQQRGAHKRMENVETLLSQSQSLKFEITIVIQFIVKYRYISTCLNFKARTHFRLLFIVATSTLTKFCQYFVVLYSTCVTLIVFGYHIIPEITVKL